MGSLGVGPGEGPSKGDSGRWGFVLLASAASCQLQGFVSLCCYARVSRIMSSMSMCFFSFCAFLDVVSHFFSGFYIH